MPLTPLQELVRWEESGGTWQVVADSDGELVIALLPCTGGEPVGSLRSAAADLREYVASR